MPEELQELIRRWEHWQRVRTLAEGFYRRRRQVATAGVGALAVWMAFHVIWGANGMVIYENKKAEYRQLQDEVNSMQKENQALTRQVDKLKHDPQAIEREAREQLRYAKPGEVIFLLPTPTPSQKPPVNAAKK
ncbi:MAG TPA: septum formation initiator family protein [Terriglobales bacterium]|nr:septum formation initiator family protein [Terriglobales bacterium]